jgi:ribosomal protein S18 acetylase RimI-like enzyme
VRITPFSQPPHLDEVLDRLGWPRQDVTRVMVRPDGPLPRAAAPAGVGAPMPVTPLEYADLIGALRGSAVLQRRAHARRILAAPVEYQGFVLRSGDAVVACGQMAVEDDLVGLYDVFTAPAERGRGLARHLCTWLLARAAERGARHAYLQVDAGNDAARAVYRRLGFGDGYAYHYRAPVVDMDVCTHSDLIAG